PPQRRYAVGTVYLRGQGTGQVRAVHGLDRLDFRAGGGIADIVVESQLPVPGQQSSTSYEGDGWVIVRHPDTAVVTEALRRLVTGVRVDLG
ncbi:MAG: hypothetical protein M3O55_09795, partial [Actinomycetota bacterium]|nr:hypothetical protein [Actinomycetota bacterium]